VHDRDSGRKGGCDESEPSGLAANEVDRDTAHGAPYRRVQSMKLFRILRDCEGQDLAEYAMLISLITLALIAALTLIGSTLVSKFQAVAAAF
jgi:Flp pilus assembly pilin Flp